MTTSFSGASVPECIAKVGDFKWALTRVIEPTGRPGVELPTLEDVDRFI
jgi:hypothetical protein